MAKGECDSQEEKVDQIYRALLGDLENNEGLISQTRSLRRDFDKMTKKLETISITVEKLDKERVFTKGKQAGMTIAAGGVGGFLAWLIQLFTKD